MSTYATFDSLAGHGYGRLGKPRGSAGEWNASTSFPYLEEPLHVDDDEEQQDDDYEVDIKLFFNDPSERGQGRVDRGSFAGSSTRGLGEASPLPRATKGIVPFPGLYDDIEAPIGGMSSKVSSPAPQTYTGSKRGFSLAPSIPWEDELTFKTLQDLPMPDERALRRAQEDHAEIVAETMIYFRSLMRSPR